VIDPRIQSVIDSVKFHPGTAINIENLRWKPDKRTLKNIGSRFGSVVIVDYAYHSGGRPYLIIQCDCGVRRSVSSSEVKRGNYQTCKLCDRSVRRNHWSWKGIGDMSSETYRQWLNSAKERGLEFTVDKEYVYSVFLRQNKKCAITGVDLTFGGVGNTGRTASLDRIDNNSGYVHGNVQFIHRTINYMRADMDIGDFLSICKMVTDHSGSMSGDFKKIDMSCVMYKTSRIWNKKRKTERKSDSMVDIYCGPVRGFKE